ncbi:MAG: hypothetical protein JWQ97_302 [Phenylobacterium sp.]|nr:hypothetical protein [Phenylobacterium sp.]
MSAYTDLITSEHADKVRFVATVDASTKPFADLAAVLDAMSGAFDLDSAVGAQLDIVGQWVGISRQVVIPIAAAYFSWDTAGLGWDRGFWRRPFDPTQGITSLPDEPYRTLLRATVALNQWDGTLPSAQAAIAPVFPNNPVAISDNQNMTMTVIVSGPSPDPVTVALLTGGYLALRPGCIGISYLFSSAPPAPVFGWDVVNSYFGGWDQGAWGVPTPPV